LKKIDPEQKRLAESLYQLKRERRRRLAALPIEEKIRLLVELQRRANEIRKMTGRRPLPEWKL
jgi:hypothetical protein